VGRALAAGDGVMVLTAVTVLLIALAANVEGVRTNVRVLHAGSWALVALAIVLLLSAATRGVSGLSTVAPDAGDLDVLLPGVVLAFWAFVGFENLTFLSGEFRHPERDLLPVSAIALGVYGLLTVLLTVAIAVRLPRGQADEVVGLLQLAHTMRPRQVTVTAVTLIAFGAVVLNTVAWVWGVSRLVAAAAGAAILPRALAQTTEQGVPRRAVLFLGSLCAVALTVLVLFPGILVDAVATASAIFIMLYLMSIVSYVRVRGLTVRSVTNLLLFLLLAASLVESGWRSLYGVVALVLALLAQVFQRRRGIPDQKTSPTRPDPSR
jgi:amino acid efflux transporter